MYKNEKFQENLSSQIQLNSTQLKELDMIEQAAIARFYGELSELESALGMLRLGQQYGWRVMYLIHSKATVRKYESILEVSIKDVMPEVGPSAHRCRGYRISQKLGNFWKIVSGETKVANKKKTD